MPSDVELRGLDDLARLTRNLKAAGEQGKGLKRELTKSLNAETKQTRKDMRAAIPLALPKRGGLAADVLRSTRFSTSVSTSGANVGVRIKARGRRGIRRMNTTGSLRHPVFGSKTWVTQTAGIEKGFLDRPFEKSRPEMRVAVLRAITRIGNQVEKGI